MRCIRQRRDFNAIELIIYRRIFIMINPRIHIRELVREIRQRERNRRIFRAALRKRRNRRWNIWFGNIFNPNRYRRRSGRPIIAIVSFPAETGITIPVRQRYER